ncbi:MAG: transposase [Verrucomicrobiales bacterium]|nr:transposase [Verrucomicrobiales bacterium]
MKNSQSPDIEEQIESDPLVGVNAKTSWYPAARGGAWSGGRKRILGPKALESNYYHVMSRTCGGEIFFDDTEKEALRRVIWRVAEFCGVSVLTYCIMGNHFHVLVSVPHRQSWMQRFEGPEGERRLLGHLRSLYSKAYIEQLEAEIREWRRLGMESMVEKKLESFRSRMCDLSRFVKEVKERFSRWYNKRHERRGTLWMDRFKSVLIEDARSQDAKSKSEGGRVDVVRAMAAYIDLNPVRAGLVADSKDYPWCGYGEACSGKRKAQRGLCRIVGKPVDGWEMLKVGKVYFDLLVGVDGETGKRRASGALAEASGAEKERSKRLTMRELVRFRVRAFSESMVLGSKAFVEDVFQANRSLFGAKRSEGARRLAGVEAPVYAARRVRQRFEAES